MMFNGKIKSNMRVKDGGYGQWEWMRWKNDGERG